VQGTLEGDTSGVNYGADDPDCWWTRSQCVSPKHDGIPEDIHNVPEPKALGYGFDDGPNCSHNAFYDYLTQKEQKASTSLTIHLEHIGILMVVCSYVLYW